MYTIVCHARISNFKTITLLVPFPTKTVVFYSNAKHIFCEKKMFYI